MKVYFLFIFLVLFNTILTKEDTFNEQEYEKSMDEYDCSHIEYPHCQSKILGGNRLCCEIIEQQGHNVKQTCEMKTTKEDQMTIVGSSKLINRELGGLGVYNEHYGGTHGDSVEERREEVERTITINCATWSFTVDILEGEYSNEEINILQSENHCLSYFNPYLKHTGSNRRNVTRETCYKASLLPSTIRSGISCGYMEIDIEEPSAKEKRTTCFLYDPNVANNKVLDEATRLNMNTMTRKIEDDKINYNYTIYKSNGKGYSYDSLTAKVTNVMDSPEHYSNEVYGKEPTDSTDSGNMITINSIWVILIILSLL